jgi:hypothetical protein
MPRQGPVASSTSKKKEKKESTDSNDSDVKPKKKNKKHNRQKKKVDMSKNHIEDNLEYTEFLEECIIDSKKCYVPVIKNKLVDGNVYNINGECIGISRNKKIIFFM